MGVHRRTGPDHGGRVLIIGDSAHALPPSAGQGVNQAFEDVYTLGLTLGKLFGTRHNGFKVRQSLEQALRGWQSFCQACIDHVLGLNRQMDLRRMPTSANLSEEELEKSKSPLDFDWLCKVDFETAVEEYLRDMGLP